MPHSTDATDLSPHVTRAAIDGTRPAAAAGEAAEHQRASRRIADVLALLKATLAPQRRLVRAGERLYQAGDRFVTLHVMNSGFFKLVTISADGREQVVGLKLRGDWLGFDGIANGVHSCDAVALDTGEVWSFRYDALLVACTGRPELLRILHEAMSAEIARDRDSLMSMCTLPADARVADFLRQWAESMARRGQRTDEIALRMSRAEIGNYLGMTIESVSRALSRLARDEVIGFPSKGRREVRIPNIHALSAFVQRRVSPTATLQ